MCDVIIYLCSRYTANTAEMVWSIFVVSTKHYSSLLDLSSGTISVYIVALSNTSNASLDQTTLDIMPQCGTVIPPVLGAIIALDLVCQPHIYTWRRYLYICQAQEPSLHIFELEVNIITEISRYNRKRLHNFWIFAIAHQIFNHIVTPDVNCKYFCNVAMFVKYFAMWMYQSKLHFLNLGPFLDFHNLLTVCNIYLHTHISTYISVHIFFVI